MSMLMLLLDPPPIPPTVAPKVRVEAPKKATSRNYTGQLKAANVAKTTKSQERYREALGENWVSTEQLEVKLKYYRSSILDTLRKYEREGLVGRRSTGKTNALEWRWIK
jgi:hypothetical protein